MKRSLLAAAIALAPISAQAQQAFPQVTQINDNDLFQVIVHGVPAAQNKYAAATLLGSYYNASLLKSNNTWTGQNVWTNTTLPTPASGTLALAGIASTPTMNANGEGAAFLSTTNGLSFMGQGSSGDVTLLNSAGQRAAYVPTGTQNLTVPSLLTASYLRANQNNVTLSGSTIPTNQGFFVQNLLGTSTVAGDTWGSNVLIGNSSDNAKLASGAAWNELFITGNFGGAAFTGGRIGMNAILNFNTASTLASVSDGLVGYASVVKATANAGGTSSGYGVSQFGLGRLFGANPWCNLAPGATFWNSCAGQETDIEVQSGASVSNLVGEAVVLINNHAVHGTHQDIGYYLASQTGASVGLYNGFVVGNYTAQWPIDPNGYLFQTQVGANDSTVPANAAGGIDLLQTNFTGTGPVGGGFAFRSPGYSVDGSGRGQFGYGVIDGTSGGLAIAPSELELSGTPTVSAGGAGYVTGDYVEDQYGNIFTVTASGGVVSAVTVKKRGFVSAAPSNPIATTATTWNGSQLGQGLTLTESWAGGANLTLSGNGSGNVAIGASSDTITMPSIPTSGTATASLCVDAGGHIFKKTTSGACL